MEKQRDTFYENVNNYTKYKLVQMLIKKHQEDRLNNLDNLNEKQKCL